MSLSDLQKSQIYKRKGKNLIKLGFNFDQDDEKEFRKIQKVLFTEYHMNKESMITIGKKFGIPSTKTMDTLFKLFDIETRNLSEATYNAMDQGRYVFDKYGYYLIHKTWFGEEVYLRSSYEESYAKLLDQQKVYYEVEPFNVRYYDTTTARYRIAVPDFYIPSLHKIVEIKAEYWLDQEEMDCKEKEYRRLGFQFELVVGKVKFP